MGTNPVQRSRSPRFPGHSLGQAIVYAEKIYRGVHRSSIDSHTAYRLMGFAGKSGTSATALGSVRQFGLIEGVGNSTRISQLGLRVLEPVSAQERNDAVAEAARKPEVFRAVLNRFDGVVPSADEPVRAFLIRELGFSKAGTEDCLQSLRATLDMIQDATGNVESYENASAIGSGMAPSPVGETQTRGEQSQSLMRIPLTRECSAELRFSGHVTARAIDNLMRHIELMQGAWSDED